MVVLLNIEIHSPPLSSLISLLDYETISSYITIICRHDWYTALMQENEDLARLKRKRLIPVTEN